MQSQNPLDLVRSFISDVGTKLINPAIQRGKVNNTGTNLGSQFVSNTQNTGKAIQSVGNKIPIVGGPISDVGKTIERVATPQGRQDYATDVGKLLNPGRTYVDSKGKIVTEFPKHTDPTLFMGLSAPTEVSGFSKIGNIISEGGGKPPFNKAPEITNPTDPFFNVKKYNITPENQQILKNTVEEIKPKIQSVIGSKLSNKEIINQANQTSKILNSVVDRASTSAWEASLLKARQKLSSLAESGTVDQDYIQTLLDVKSHATDIARKLQSFSIGADAKIASKKEMLISAVSEVEKDTSKILKAAEGVDFNNANQAAAFYRKFIKPSIGEWADTLRYNSMLSSPNTHINNAFSNAINTGLVAPIEKSITGGIDFLKSAITGKDRQALAGEGASYFKGYWSKLGEASHKFVDTVKGNQEIQNLDLRNIPVATEGVKGRVAGALNLPMKLLEASDQFFKTLTEGGETAALELRKSRGINVGNIPTQATDNASYRLYRGELHDPRQGTILNAIDDITALIQRARNSDNPVTSTVAKFTLPFVRTPMNILKQGIEYSPLGITTLPGAANKAEQVSKILIGSTAATATALLAGSGRLTWAEPTDPKGKAAFRAAGMQPYAVKIGDRWVSYSKLPPAISFNIALVAAIDDGIKNKKLTDSQAEGILSGIAKWGNFFADQSYLKNIGDIVSAAKGNVESMTNFVSNYPQQLIPYRAMLGWIERLTDPYQRAVDTNGNILQKQIQQMMTQIPGLAQQVPARTSPSGVPIPNQNRIINAISPLKVTNEVSDNKQLYDLYGSISKYQKMESYLNDLVKSGRKEEALKFLKENKEAFKYGKVLKGANSKFTKLNKIKKDINANSRLSVADKQHLLSEVDKQLKTVANAATQALK